MNKILKSLVLTALTTGTVCAHDHTNHTTMNLRSQGYNLAMNYTTFNELTSREINTQFGGNFQVTQFYQCSSSGNELGKYFGFAGKHEMHLGHAGQESLYANPLFDLDSGYLLTDPWAEPADITIKFDPQSESYGAVLAYYQDLTKLAKGLYLLVSLPIVHVENDMRMDVSSSHSNGYWQGEREVSSYFRGTYIGYPGLSSYGQSGLTKAKIDGKRTATGVADIEVTLGYNFLNKETYHLGINIGTTIPTGNKNKGDYVFQPIVGNGKHWALGGGLEGDYCMWRHEERNVKLGIAIDYHYLFENNEYRTPGLKNVATGVTRNWGQYHLVGDAITYGEAENQGTILSPAANVITQNCGVTPGSQIEGLANFAYNNGGLTFDLGYNLFWREKEKVKSHKTLDVERYGVANRALDRADGVVGVVYYGNVEGTGAALFGVYPTQFDEGYEAAEGAENSLYFLSQAHLDFHQAETPAVLTHKIYSGIGYSFKEWDTPFMMGLGGSYELSPKNSAPDVWSVYGKLGVAF